MSAAVADSQLETLRDEIKQQGDEIRLLKANNADKDLVSFLLLMFDFPLYHT